MISVLKVNPRQSIVALVAATILSQSTPSLAKSKSNEPKNQGGANALVCFSDPSIPQEIRRKDSQGNLVDPSIKNSHLRSITSIEVLDLYEAKLMEGFDARRIDLIEPKSGETEQQYALRLIARLQKHFPLFYRSLMTAAQEIPAEQAINQPQGVDFVDDFNLIGRIDSDNCVIATIALQRDLGSITRLYLDNRLLHHTKHNSWSKKVIYLHELVYNVARQVHGHRDSQKTRQIVGLLMRKNISISELGRKANALSILEREDFSAVKYPGLSADFNFAMGAFNESLKTSKAFESAQKTLTETLGGQYLSEYPEVISQYWVSGYQFSIDRSAYLRDFIARREAGVVEEMKKTIPEMKCSDFSSCYALASKIAGSSGIFSRYPKETVQAAKLLVAKYNGWEKDDTRAIKAEREELDKRVSNAMRSVGYSSWREYFDKQVRPMVEKEETLTPDEKENVITLILERSREDTSSRDYPVIFARRAGGEVSGDRFVKYTVGWSAGLSSRFVSPEEVTQKDLLLPVVP